MLGLTTSSCVKTSRAPSARATVRRAFQPRPSVAAMASVHIVTNVADYPSKVQQLLSSQAPHYVVFNADPDPTTGQPWCPDCVRTLPAVRSVVASTGGSLLEVQVGPRPAWKTPDHPFRLDATLKLTGIPTLLKLEASGKEVARLGPELEAAGSPAEATQLVTAFTAK